MMAPNLLLKKLEWFECPNQNSQRTKGYNLKCKKLQPQAHIDTNPIK